MKKKFIFFIASSFLVFISIFFITNKNVFKKTFENRKALKIDNKTITAQFLDNEGVANKLFVGKTVEVEGLVKKVSFLNNEQTVYLNTPYKDVFIICEMSPNQEQSKKIKTNQTLKVKGTCKGFLKDVILLNCYIPANE